eukprot:88966-Pleurochrysis_carterae.AAC.1
MHGLVRTVIPKLSCPDRGGSPERCDVEQDGGERPHRQMDRARLRVGGSVWLILELLVGRTA